MILQKELLAGLVVTTIGDGQFLETYAKDFKRSGPFHRVRVFVIPDLKTPAALFERCQRLRKAGLEVVCPSLEEQESFLSKLGIPKWVSYNSDHRRNVGFLMALDAGVDYLISVDDDNLCRDGNFLEEHAIVCAGEDEFDVVHSSSGWFNLCELLEMDSSNVYPRGFPYRFRKMSAGCWERRERAAVHLNAGLWLQDPDLDAATWLVSPTRAISFRGRPLVLGKDTWSPINTQNTALRREAIVAFYFIRMGYTLAGMRMDRYADIFSGYFCQACVRHLGYRVRIGTPIVNHLRNSHDYLVDLTKELPCIWLLEDMAEWLRGLRLQGSSYGEAYLCLADSLDEVAEKFHGRIWDDAARNWLGHVTDDMRHWTKAVRTIEGSNYP